MSPYQNHATMQGHIAQWQASDLTQAAYCKEHGIKPHIFSYYKKKFSSGFCGSKTIQSTDSGQACCAMRRHPVQTYLHLPVRA